MTVTLRLSLTVFSVGFGLESGAGFYALGADLGELPAHGVLLFIGPLFSVLGLLLLWIGRHEWNELHVQRVRHAGLAFTLSLIALVFVVAPVIYLAFAPGLPSPSWLAIEFGAAVALTFALSFLTYALVAAHLVRRVGQAAMALGIGWAAFVSALIGITLQASLPTLAQALSNRSLDVGPITQPIVLLDSLFAFSYLAFFVAFVDAHHRVATTVPVSRIAATTGR